MLTRRFFATRALPGIAAAGVLGSLAACSGGVTSSQIQTDAQLIASGLGNVLTQLQAIPGVSISAGTVTQIQNELNVISAQEAQIGSLATPTNTIAQTFSGAVAALSALVTPFFPAAPMIAAAIQAATVLVQGIVAAANPATPPASAALNQMSPAQARLILQANTAH